MGGTVLAEVGRKEGDEWIADLGSGGIVLFVDGQNDKRVVPVPIFHGQNTSHSITHDQSLLLPLLVSDSIFAPDETISISGSSPRQQEVCSHLRAN